jgi:predicted ATPase
MAEQKSARLSLKRLGIQRFRSLYDVSLDLKPINIFIGPNGSGKSNLIAFFRFLYDMVTDPIAGRRYRPQARDLVWYGREEGEEVHEFQATLYLEHPDGQPLRYDVVVDNNLTFLREEIISGSGRAFLSRTQKRLELQIAQEEKKKKIVTIHPERLSLHVLIYSSPLEEPERIPEIEEVTKFVQGWRVVEVDPRIVRESLSQPLPPEYSFIEVPPLQPNGGNLAEFLYALQGRQPDDFDVIVERLGAAIEFVEEIQAVDVTTFWGPAKTYYFKESPFPNLIPPSAESDGTIRFLTLLSLLLGDKSPSLICLEEPDHNLHPRLMLHLADAMRYFEVLKEPHPQILVTTHSPDLLNCFNIAEESEYLNVFVVEREPQTGRTNFRLVDAERLRWWLSKYRLGELYTRRILDVIKGREEAQ